MCEGWRKCKDKGISSKPACGCVWSTCSEGGSTVLMLVCSWCGEIVWPTQMQHPFKRMCVPCVCMHTPHVYSLNVRVSPRLMGRGWQGVG